MPLSIKQFQSLANQDYVRGNRFDVSLGGAIAAGPDVTDHLMGANIAGVSYGTVDYRNASPVLKLPNDIIYNPITLTFNNDAAGNALAHFQSLNTTSIIPDVASDYSFNYFEDYTGDVILKQYSPDDKLANQVKYINAWVHQVFDVQMSMENNNIIQTFNVSLLYEYPEYS